MEGQVLKIDELIKGFQSQIEDLKLRSAPGTTPKLREGRERIAMTTVEYTKKIKEECAKIFKEIAKIWTKLVE
jgi:hypothetical protein